VALIIGLSLGAIATLVGVEWLQEWITWNARPNIVELVEAVKKTAAAAIWLLPWLTVRRMRDIGSFRLPRTWTVFLGMPIMVLSLVFLDPQRLRFPWAAYVTWEAMATGVFEELVFRGYAFRHSPQTHPRVVIFTSAICFTLLHFLNATHEPVFNVVFNMPEVFVLGLAFSIIRLVSGSLAWCMLLHGATNVFATLKTDNETFQMLTPLVIGLIGIASMATCFLQPKLRGRGVMEAVASVE
jgi:membrane protease YdiL (CAAX protease family)